MRVSLNDPQADFIELPHKFRAFVSGYGGGKTWVGSTAMCLRFYSAPKVPQAYYAPTYPHIRDIFFPTIEEVADSCGLRVKIKQTDKEVEFYSGSRYRGITICRSMEIPGSIIGYKVGHSMVDELDVMAPEKAKEAWRKIIARLRWPSATNGVDVTTTPEGFRETHRLFVGEPSKKPFLKNSYGLIQASTYDNEANLPEGYIQSLVDTYPAELIQAYIQGQFCNLTSGTVYHKYDRARHESTETIKHGLHASECEPLFIGMDFNIGKMAATVYVKRVNGFHAVAEISDGFDTPAVIGIIRSKWHNHRIIVYPDASGGSASTKNASVSDISLLRNAGFEIRANPSNPAVRDRILATNKQFEIGNLWVNSRECPQTAKCFEQQAYDKNGEPDKKSGFDHANDASTYPIAYEFPIIKPISRIQIGGI